MRPWLLILGICLGLPSLVSAQETPSLPPTPAAPVPWEIAMPRELPASPPLYVQRQPPSAIERNPLLDVDILLGLPVAVRAGLAVFRHNEQAFLLEGMAGVELILPFVAAGARYRFVAWHGQRSELVIKPGVDVYAVYAPAFFGNFVGADVACVFLHNGPHHGFEWGVDLGAIGSFGRSSGAVPLASFILGFNF